MFALVSLVVVRILLLVRTDRHTDGTKAGKSDMIQYCRFFSLLFPAVKNVPLFIFSRLTGMGWELSMTTGLYFF